MSFYQDAPELKNQYRDDRPLRRYLDRVLPSEVFSDIEPELEEMGELAAGPHYALSLKHRLDEPEHIPFDAWGKRIDEVRVNAAWDEYAKVAATHGVVATGYERKHGAHSRVHQFALVYLFDPSSQYYTCPLAMTDGCARSLEVLAPDALRDQVLPHLIARDPDKAWTSGQWMTERIGGSDVGQSETTAKKDGADWLLRGTKWFTSAVTSQVALTLARPEGNGPGGKGLALFLVRVRDESGRLQNILVHRLKDKLGTRQLPTAELSLEDTPAILIGDPHDGVRHMSTMLNITRTWNAVCSAAKLRRGVALARNFASKRVAFGAPLSEKPLHLETLADLAAEQQASCFVALHVAGLLGREEAGELDDAGAAILRLSTPIAKLLTAKQAVAGTSEVCEAFGGAGYMEDTGIPELLRDTQVFPIWEGTTNVLSLEAFRSIQRADALKPFTADIRERAANAEAIHDALDHAESWWAEAAKRDPAITEAGARQFSVTLGRCLAGSLLVEQAVASDDVRDVEAARRFMAHGIDCIATVPDVPVTRALALDV